MTDWEERIQRGSDPATVLEHVVRYRAAATIVSGADVWIDLGCGTGYAASIAFGELDPRPRRALLVDVDESATDAAVDALNALNPDRLVADLSEPHGRASVADAVDWDADRIAITCFETLEHLANFADLISWLIERSNADAMLSVPNDAFWAIENPYHETKWNDAAFGELLTLLPDHVAGAQFPLVGSWIARVDDCAGAIDVAARRGEARVPSHLIVAIGPRREQLGSAVDAHRLDLHSRRTWERQRESQLQWLEQRVADLEYLMAQHGLDSRVTAS